MMRGLVNLSALIATSLAVIFFLPKFRESSLFAPTDERIYLRFSDILHHAIIKTSEGEELKISQPGSVLGQIIYFKFEGKTQEAINAEPPTTIMFKGLPIPPGAVMKFGVLVKDLQFAETNDEVIFRVKVDQRIEYEQKIKWGDRLASQNSDYASISLLPFWNKRSDIMFQTEVVDANMTGSCQAAWIAPRLAIIDDSSKPGQALKCKESELVILLDGASWKMFLPMIKIGRVPCMAKFYSYGYDFTYTSESVAQYIQESKRAIGLINLGLEKEIPLKGGYHVELVPTSNKNQLLLEVIPQDLTGQLEQLIADSNEIGEILRSCQMPGMLAGVVSEDLSTYRIADYLLTRYPNEQTIIRFKGLKPVMTEYQRAVQEQAASIPGAYGYAQLLGEAIGNLYLLSMIDPEQNRLFLGNIL